MLANPLKFIVHFAIFTDIYSNIYSYSQKLLFMDSFPVPTAYYL